MHAKDEGTGIHLQWIRGEPNHQQFSSYGESFHEIGHSLTTWSSSEDGVGSAKRSQLGSRILRPAVNVFVCPEFLCEFLRLRTETSGDSPESHPSRVLNAEMTESANALDCDERTCTQPVLVPTRPPVHVLVLRWFRKHLRQLPIP